MSARTDLPIEIAKGSTPLTKEVLAFTAADVALGNEFTFTGGEVLIARNTGASPRNVTFQSLAVNGRQDPLHATAISLAAGEFALFGPFDGRGWRQGDGYVQVSADHAEVTFCVIRMPD